MYKIKLWDEDKWDIRSSSYNSSKYGNLSAADKGGEGKTYHEQKYGSEGKSPSSDYLKKEEDKENTNIKNQDSPEFLLNDEQKIEQKTEEEELPFKAAKQIFSENKNTEKSAKQIFLSDEKTNAKTIEDAIKKAIEEEKKVIIMDS